MNCKYAFWRDSGDGERGTALVFQNIKVPVPFFFFLLKLNTACGAICAE